MTDRQELSPDYSPALMKAYVELFISPALLTHHLHLHLLLSVSFTDHLLKITSHIIMEEEIEELRFEELDDDDFNLEELDDSKQEEEEIQKPVEDTFTQFYTPIRTIFANDSKLLERFGQCLNHEERLSVLLEQDIVVNSLNQLKKEESVNPEVPPPKPETPPKPWKTPPKLSYGPNKKFPHLSKALDVKFSKAEGRFLVAKQKINPGDVLIVDTPYATSLFEEYKSTHCNYCFKRLPKDAAVDYPSCDKVNMNYVEIML